MPFKIPSKREFCGSPMVRTPHFHCWGPRSLGTKIPQAAQCSQNKQTSNTIALKNSWKNIYRKKMQPEIHVHLTLQTLRGDTTLYMYTVHVHLTLQTLQPYTNTKIFLCIVLEDIKIIIIPKRIYKFNAISIKMPLFFGVAMDQLTLKFIWKCKTSRIAKIIFWKYIRGGLRLPDKGFFF